jgi:predicted membrane channel-forming protein YqfA (hemolysin III family)
MGSNNDVQYFRKMYESRTSIREVEIVSEASGGSYEISPYSIRKEEPVNINRIISGSIICILGMIIMVVGVRKQIRNSEDNETQYWIASVLFLLLGISIIYHTIQTRYRLIENYS